MEERLEKLRQSALALGLPEEQRKTMTADDLRTFALDSLCKSIGGAKGVHDRLPQLRKECLEWETINAICEQHDYATQGLEGAKAIRNKLCADACLILPFSAMPNISPNLVLNLAVHMTKVDDAAASRNMAHQCMKWRGTLLRQELDGIERCIKVAETLAATTLSSPVQSSSAAT